MRATGSLWPREHGAYMALAFPMASALWVADRAPQTWGFALAAWLAFFAHEPWLVWTGRRGAARRRSQGPAARRRMFVLAAGAAMCGGLSLWGAPWSAWIAAGVIALLAGLAFWRAAAAGERDLGVQLWVTWCLAGVSVPVALIGGVPPSAALALVVLWGSGVGVAMLCVRGVVYRKRDGATYARVAAAAGLTLIVAVSLAAGLLSAPWLLAPTPFGVASLFLLFRPPSLKRLKALGWGLTSVNVVMLAWLIVTWPV